MRLWIDTDVGDNPDDAVALLAAAAHPDVDLVGVSTTGGRTGVAGRAGPGAGADRSDQARVVAGERADDLLRAFRAASPEAVLAIGPLTNVAALLALGVGMPRLTVMGGALTPVEHRGRVQAVEHNFAADPAAAAVVVAMTDATIVPLDATVAMRVDAAAGRPPRARRCAPAARGRALPRVVRRPDRVARSARVARVRR